MEMRKLLEILLDDSLLLNLSIYLPPFNLRRISQCMVNRVLDLLCNLVIQVLLVSLVCLLHRECRVWLGPLCLVLLVFVILFLLLSKFAKDLVCSALMSASDAAFLLLDRWVTWVWGQWVCLVWACLE
jgi:hypothetical protein